MKKHRKQFVNFVERELKCELVDANANLLHFRAKTDNYPFVKDIERVFARRTDVKRHYNILVEHKNPQPFEVAFTFAGMHNIPAYLTKTFGGFTPKPHIWQLYNMSRWKTDQRGCINAVLPDAEEIKTHIDTIYHLLNPNCKKRDFHKRKVELLSYNEEHKVWECGNADNLATVFVQAPSYLAAGSYIYINSYKKGFEFYGKTFEYYGKGWCKEVNGNDYALLFSVKPDAIYDWFYSSERTFTEVERTFNAIEYSFKHRPWLYYCKGEYTKVRQLFLSETLKWLSDKHPMCIKALSCNLKRALTTLIKNRKVATAYYITSKRNLLAELR